MLYEGQIESGVKVITNIRERYDGLKRNPFDEAECGHHYARAMASWAAVLALSGFHYSAVNHHLQFSAQAGRHFWSNGYAWGTCKINSYSDHWQANLTVLYGTLRVKHFELLGIGINLFENELVLEADTPVNTVEITLLTAR
jgi:hypothetical protein